jgi:hypothetical protein
LALLESLRWGLYKLTWKSQRPPRISKSDFHAHESLLSIERAGNRESTAIET